MNALAATTDVINALGGTTKVALLTGRSAQAVSNWRTISNFPPDTFLVMTSALTAQGFSAPPSLWKQCAAPIMNPLPRPVATGAAA